jgi:hypothetical protein
LIPLMAMPGRGVDWLRRCTLQRLDVWNIDTLLGSA